MRLININSIIRALNLPSFTKVVSELDKKQNVNLLLRTPEKLDDVKKRQNTTTTSTSNDGTNLNATSICNRLPTRVFQVNIGLYCNQPNKLSDVFWATCL